MNEEAEKIPDEEEREIDATNRARLGVEVPAKLLELTGLLVERAVFLDEWHLRLLELWVWIKYCAASKENAWRFYSDAVRDAHGLMEKHFEICDLVGIGREHESEMRKSVATLVDVLGLEHGDAGYLAVAKAAKEIGLDNWFSPCNVYYSKLVHPTAFQVAFVMREAEFMHSLQVMVTAQGAYFAGECTNALQEIILAIQAQ